LFTLTIMADWNFKNEDGIDTEFENIQLLFLSGKVKHMYELLERSPTKIASLLGLNYNSYHDKLRNPEKFTSLHINTIAYAIRINPDIIHNVIQKEILEQVIQKFEKYKSK